MSRKPGYGRYRGHNYKIVSKGKSPRALYATADDAGGLHSAWHPTVEEAVADFKAGVDDILGGPQLQLEQLEKRLDAIHSRTDFIAIVDTIVRHVAKLRIEQPTVSQESRLVLLLIETKLLAVTTLADSCDAWIASAKK